LVIGAGGGAYPTAFRLARSGLDVVMVDPKGVLVGNCLYLGCIHSKTLREFVQLSVRSGRLLNYAPKSELGRYQEHKDSVKKIRFDQHNSELAEFPNVHFFKGTVEFKTKNEAMAIQDGHQFEVSFDHAIIAT
jgi:dihydrolipoamide dehydrogenase